MKVDEKTLSGLTIAGLMDGYRDEHIDRINATLHFVQQGEALGKFL